MKLPLHGRSLAPLLACGLLLGAGAARAAVTYSGVVNIGIPTSFNGVYLNLDTPIGIDPNDPVEGTDIDPVPDVDFGYTIGYSEPADWDVNFFFGGIGIAYSDTFNPFVDDSVAQGSQILNVAIGTNIQSEAASRTLGVNSFGGSGRPNGGSGESHFDTPTLNNATYSAFTPGGQGYIAFALDTDDNGTDDQFGWMRVTLTNDGTPGTVHDWAYSDEASFTVGQIPEPSSLMLLLLGSLGLLRRKR
jgi:hypothetical protein